MADSAPATAANLSAKQNTKVENLAEAIENLIAATAAQILGQIGDVDKGKPNKMVQQFQKDARAELRTNLREFVLPSLRIIDGGGRPGYEPSVPKADHVMCAACNRDRICSDPNCPDWHKALRNTIKPPAAEEDEDDFDDSGDDVA